MKNALFLAQSDTTAGFLSKDRNKITKAKQSPKNKMILLESASLSKIKDISRIPKSINTAIRRRKKSTFIFPNNHSFRVVKNEMHLRFLKYFGVLYSSSANKHNESFSSSFAQNAVDVVVWDNRGIFESPPSQIFCVRKNRIKKIR